MSIEVKEIIRSNRRTLALIVKPDGSLIVRAPLKAPHRSIREFVEKMSNGSKGNRHRLAPLCRLNQNSTSTERNSSIWGAPTRCRSSLSRNNHCCSMDASSSQRVPTIMHPPSLSAGIEPGQKRFSPNELISLHSNTDSDMPVYASTQRVLAGDRAAPRAL